ncbi:hypothetical protein [Dactylosporangium sp. NPDC006015]|uniref:hypothetical protein n=1 Tax=Dactylosporangium sp. NPDC006015 TaxID=3154576 RepID=UPI00339EE444
MNPLRMLVEAVADYVHAPGDAHSRSLGMTVQRLPWGRRRVCDPMLAVYAKARRDRVLRGGGDAYDRLLLGALRPGERYRPTAKLAGRR